MSRSRDQYCLIIKGINKLTFTREIETAKADAVASFLLLFFQK